MYLDNIEIYTHASLSIRNIRNFNKTFAKIKLIKQALKMLAHLRTINIQKILEKQHFYREVKKS